MVILGSFFYWIGKCACRNPKPRQLPKIGVECTDLGCAIVRIVVVGPFFTVVVSIFFVVDTLLVFVELVSYLCVLFEDNSSITDFISQRKVKGYCIYTFSYIQEEYHWDFFNLNLF